MVLLLYFLTGLTHVFVWLLRLVGRSGTALPGLWVERYAPWLIGSYGRRFAQVILITGTNGKTTTQHTLSTMLEAHGMTVVRNASGSNMLRGIAVTLLLHGPAAPRTVFLCETEEGTMPRLTRHLPADIIVITNLYRDQLDAYGELHTTARYIRTACEQCPTAILIVNADDPSLLQIYQDLPHTKYLYGLAPGLRGDFAYESQALSPSHLHLLARQVETMPDLSSQVTLIDWQDQTGKEYRITFAPPGIYNIYNLLAAVLVARVLAVPVRQIVDAAETVQAPFGRGEIVTLARPTGQVTIQIFLVKNPAGFGQVWQLLQSLPTKCLLVGLNDQTADGRDVSWIWDIALEKYLNTQSKNSLLACTGTRAHDMALRLKYAEVVGDKAFVEPQIDKIVDAIISHPGHIYALMTYTAMNELRRSLGRYTPIHSFQAV